MRIMRIMRRKKKRPSPLTTHLNTSTQTEGSNFPPVSIGGGGASENMGRNTHVEPAPPPQHEIWVFGLGQGWPGRSPASSRVAALCHSCTVAHTASLRFCGVGLPEHSERNSALSKRKTQ
eukprot:6926903-Pyramimonas_sp.AAC.1